MSWTKIFEGATSPGYKKLENVWFTGHFCASGWTPTWPLPNATAGDFKSRRPTGRPLLSKNSSRYGLFLWARGFVAWFTNPGTWLECQLWDIIIKDNHPCLLGNTLPVRRCKHCVSWIVQKAVHCVFQKLRFLLPREKSPVGGDCGPYVKPSDNRFSADRRCGMVGRWGRSHAAMFPVGRIATRETIDILWVMRRK